MDKPFAAARRRGSGGQAIRSRARRTGAITVCMKLDDKHILVTGGSTGIGAATALALATAGAKVTITGRTEATLRSAAARHANLAYAVADAADPGAIARTLARFDRLDALVNNAGIAEVAPLARADRDHVRRLFDINVAGLIETTRLALPLLERSKGVIVNLASTVADRPFPNMSAYSATKAAVLALTRAWAHELAPLGIRVNAVSPGPIETPIFNPDKMRVSQAELEAFGPIVRAKVAMGRFGRPEEVASVIGFLVSSEASFVTGAQYSVGGGIEA
jgi:NAD(P)-dependent dehydrogenase (short-subunit alcohol dehydrogenase family)